MPNYTNRAVQYIQDQAGEAEPFFMYMPLTAPHSPIVPPGFIPAGGTSYDRFIKTVDWAVGQVLDALETSGIAGETLIIFASDNGVSKNFSTSDNISPGFIDGTPLRGQKADIWEAGHRGPFIVRWDGHVQAGSTSDEYVELNDLYATLAQVVGQTLPPTVAEDSYSILSVLEGEAIDGPLREAGVNHSINGTFAIRQFDDQGNEWKLVFNSGSGGWTGPVGTKVGPNAAITNFSALQLYNLTTDVGEQTNLLADGVTQEEENLVLAMQVLLQQYMADGRSNVALLCDLNGDGDLTAADWAIYKAGFDQDMSALSPLASYGLGDLNGDLVNDHTDFVLFKNAYDAANGLGAFEALGETVPEPSSVALLLFGSSALLLCRRRTRPIKTRVKKRMMITPRFKSSLFAIASCLLSFSFCGVSSADILIDDHFDNGNIATGGTNGGFVVATNHGAGGANPAGTATEAGTDATLTTGGAWNNDGLYSLNSFDSTAVVGLAATIVVTSISSDPQANGLFFGITDDNTTFFRAQDNFGLIFSGHSNYGNYALVANDIGAGGTGLVLATGSLDLVRTNWGNTAVAATSAVPEPSTIGLFAFAAIAVVGLRRRTAIAT